MSTLHVVIISPEGTAFEGECSEAYFPAEKGPIGILPGHTTFIAPLAEKGVARLKSESRNIYFGIKGGALEVREDKTICLALSCFQGKNEEEAKTFANS